MNLKKALTAAMSWLMLFSTVASPVYADDVLVNDNLLVIAEQYYGDNGNQKVGVLNIAWDNTNINPGTVKAGEDKYLTVSWTLDPAATYSYTDQQEPLFDSYQNTKIAFVLPEGVTIDETVANTLQGVKEVTHEGTLWYMHLNPTLKASTSNSGTITVPVKVDGNGVRGVGEVLDFEQNVLQAKMLTEFDILDRSDPLNITKVKSYQKTIAGNSDLGKLKTVSDDVWGIEKTVVSALPNDGKDTVTVTFNLTIGLLGENNTIITNANSYARNGRVPFAKEMVLKETPSVNDRQGNPIQPISIYLIPQFGNQIPVDITNQTDNYQLPVNTCVSDPTLTNVASTAPFLSTYQVQITYPYDKFIASFEDDNQDLLTVDNEAEIIYQLKGEGEKTAESKAAIDVGEVLKPSKLNIQKYIVDKDNKAKLYSNDNFADDPVRGKVEFTITEIDGSPAVLYKLDNGKYVNLDSNKVTLDESASGTAEIWLKEGTYKIEETSWPSKTRKATGSQNNADDKTVVLTVGDEQTVAFYNEELIGSITINKTGKNADGQTSPLNGAVFGLYSDQNCGTLIKSGETSNGSIVFDRLPYGTYYIKEISAPSGYVVSSKIHSITVNDDDRANSIDIVNDLNHTYVRLDKYVANNEGNYRMVDDELYREFNGVFSLQYQNGNDWQDIDTNLSLNENGTYLTSLAVYDDDGQAINYRFKEVLPQGYHDPDNSYAQEMYSEEFTLVDHLGKGSTDPKVVVMKNDRNGSIELTKKFYDITADGYQQVNDKEAIFNLYRTIDNNSYELYKEDLSTDGGQLVINDLPRFDSNANAYEYYLAEEEINDYALDNEQSGDNTANENLIDISYNGNAIKAFGPFDFASHNDEDANLNQTITVANYEQKVGIIVKKVDAITKNFVAGAKFTVYRGEASEIYQAETEITSTGIFVKLDLGNKYRIEETTVPSGYTIAEGEAEIDLTNVTTVDKTKTVQIITLSNRPDPKIKVNKTIIGNNQTVASTDVSFEVYQKNGENFDPVTKDGLTLEVSAGSELQLPVGTYYLKEKNNNKTLDPSVYHTLYDEHGEFKEGSFYFGPFELKKVDQTNDLVQPFAIENYSVYGAIKVKKYAKEGDGSLSPLSGATIGVYQDDNLVNQQNSNSAGEVVFTGLPIYNGNSRITYTIKEISAPDGYGVDKSVLSVQLEAGETVTQDTIGSNLQFVNLPKMSFAVSKVFYNIWEHQFTSREYLMSGARIALFEKGDDNKYHFIELATTDNMGTAVFDGLEQDKEYIAIEYDVPATDEYRYLEPINGHKYLKEDYAIDELTNLSLSETDANSYYYVSKSANSNNPEELVEGTLYNVEHWAQLHIFKYIQSDTAADGKRPINNADFTLYMQIVADNETTLEFDRNNIENYKVVGHYSSGTLYDKNGIRQDGWFATDILKSADNIVYWLVEETPGIGAKQNMASEITLIRREGTSFTNDSTASDNNTECNTVWEYRDDQVVSGEIKNYPAEGEGEEMYSTVRIAKWAGAYDEDGNRLTTYDPLGNVSFDLYVVHEDGTVVEKIDTLTTGLDNDLSGSVTNLTAWASSRAFSFDLFFENYKDDNNGEKDVIWRDTEGNGYVRVMLKETSTPGGYDMAAQEFKMIMYFEEGSDPTEIFNDVYYVKDGSAVTLAEDQTGWAFYPTKEQSEGNFEPVDVTDMEETQYRLVNWPVDNFAVTVNKYGYEVTEQNLGMNAAELDEYYLNQTGRVPLAGIEFKLQRYSTANGWVDYVYSSENGINKTTFTTDGNGYFAFPAGLGVGRYRLIETKGSNQYENIYNGNARNDSYYNAYAYYFNVISDNVHISLYNPENIDITIKKQTIDNTTLSGAVFRLQKGSVTVDGADDSGTITFGNLGSGVYKLSEITAPNGYDNGYLELYLKDAYINSNKVNVSDKEYSLANFAGEGIYLGYTTSFNNGDVVVKQVIDLSNYSADTLVVKDPSLSSLTIAKKDAQNSNISLAGAKFKIEFQPFTSWSGEETVTDSGWTLIGNNYVTEANGSVTVNSLRPGIYKVTEIQAPGGYNLDSEPQVFILKGGMNKTVTYNGNVLNEDYDLIFENHKLVDLVLRKEIDKGSLTINEDYSFTFKLKSADGKVLDTQTVNFDHTQPNPGLEVIFSGLIQGATYYLEEVNDEGFALSKVTVNNQAVPLNDNSWSFTVPNDGKNVAVTATNTYLFGKIVILKVDAENGEGLAGAGFEAYRYRGNNPMTASTGDVTDLGKGEYEIIVPLTSLKGNRFKIQEIAAPYGYLKEYPFVDVMLEPGKTIIHGDYDETTMQTGDRTNDDPIMLKELIFPNYRGSVIKLTKYDNMKEAVSALPLAEVDFTLYEYRNNSWRFVETVTTDDKGEAIFTVKSGSKYAVRETSIPEGFTGLQGLWSSGVKQPTETYDNNTYYLINNGNNLVVGNNYEYHAYNIPEVELEVQKYDVNDLNSQNPPTATVSIYQVPGSTPAILSEEEVLALMNENAVILKDVAVVTNSNQGYSYANKNTLAAMDESFAAGNTYLVVETESSISQIRNDEQVVWYAVHTIPSGTKEKQIVKLYNLEGKVEHSLSKTTSVVNYDSLLLSGAELQYTIIPEIDNTYPLAQYFLIDSGLEAYNGETQLNFDQYLKNHYSINQVKLGSAKHDDESVINATVTFYDFENHSIYSETVTLDKEQTVILKSATKAKAITITYRAKLSNGLASEVLGKNFEPDPVEVTIALDKQSGGEGVYPITKVVNTAKSTVRYNKWTNDGAIINPPTEDIKTATALNDFGELNTALVSFDKSVNTTSVALDGGVATYTLKIENDAVATGSMGNPFIVDLLPKGTQFVGDLADIIIEAPEAIGVEHFRTDTRNGETALFLFLNGDLEPGKEISIKIPIRTTMMAAVYGPTITNYAIVGSRVQGVQSIDNPRATSYKTKEGLWPNDLDHTLTSLNQERREILKEMLDDMAGFGYLGDASVISWNSSTGASLIKTGRGDRSQDIGFSSTYLATVNNDGYMDYQLIFSNLSTTENYTNVTLLDVLPFVGDKTEFDSARGSQWQMIFDRIEKVEIIDDNGMSSLVPSDKYRVFYYTQKIEEDDIEDVYDAIDSLKYDATVLPSGWTEDDSQKDRATAIAVAIVKDADWDLEAKQSYMVTYQLNVGLLDEIELAQISWTNAVNNFTCHYQHYVSNAAIDSAVDAVSVLSSNSVSNTIMPNPVKVGGHIWIDKDADGVWDDGEYVADFNGQNELINRLLDVVEVRLYTYEGTNGYATNTSTYNKENDQKWNNSANFIFSGLDPASKKDSFTEEQLYSNNTRNNPLQPAYLKGEAAKTYNIGITIPETAGLYLDVTSLGGGDSTKKTGYSRHPLELMVDGIHAAEAADNNYLRVSARTASSERFFLHPTAESLFDNTKDIGIVFYRDLIIEKADELQPDIKLANAEFKIYGPFSTEQEANAAVLDETNLITTVVTDDKGNAKVTGLNWFQYYVIVESQSPQYYQNKGAEASNADGVIHEYTGTATQKSAWILAVPGDNITNTQQKVLITNTVEIEYTIEAVKMLDGKNLEAKQFEFSLLDEDLQPIADLRSTNDAAGKIAFGPIAARETGQYVYYLEEIVPEGAKDNVYGDIEYDDQLIKVIVNVVEDENDNNRLKADVTYYQKNEDDNWVLCSEAKFNNTYLPSQTTAYQPVLFKQFTDDSDERTKLEEFDFILRATEDYGTKAVLGDNQKELKATVRDQGSTVFEEIHFNGEGEFHFIITEVDGGVKGYKYDKEPWLLTVVTAKVNGVLEVVEVNYQNSKTDKALHATFENAYYADLSAVYQPVLFKQFTDDSDKRPQDARFDFTLRPLEDYGSDIEWPKLNEQGMMETSVLNEGTAYFEELVFKAEGTFSFVISETDRQERGFTYDKQVWTLKVTTKKVEGKLVVISADYLKEDNTVHNQAIFTNHYKHYDLIIPPTGDLNILASLSMVGLILAIGGRVIYRKRRRLTK